MVAAGGGVVIVTFVFCSSVRHPIDRVLRVPVL